jgi:hypothetical protein
MKEASACGMQQLITNSESASSLGLLSFFLPLAALSSEMTCFVGFPALEGSSEEAELREFIRGISQSLGLQCLCLIFLDHTAHGESFFILLLILVLILVLQRLELLHFPLTSVELVHN